MGPRQLQMVKMEMRMQTLLMLVHAFVSSVLLIPVACSGFNIEKLTAADDGYGDVKQTLLALSHEAQTHQS